MGEFPMKLLTGVDELAVQEQFTRDVRQLGNEITNRFDLNDFNEICYQQINLIRSSKIGTVIIYFRNLTWTAPYNYLHPKNVAFRIDL